jgi:hypothetical protein
MALPQTVAIEQLEEALEDGQLDHSSRASLLFLLAKAFHTRFYSHGAIADVEAAIKKYHEAIAYHGDAKPELPKFTMHLANAYVDKHEETRDMETLVQPIQYIENALKLISQRHDDRPKFYRFLTNAYTARYQQTTQGADLNFAIRNARALLSSDTQYGKDTMSMRKVLCRLYYTKCVDGDLSDLDAAIQSLQGLLQMIRKSDKEDMSFYHELLGDLYVLKYETSKSSKDLHSAIQSRRIAAAMSGNDDPKKRPETPWPRRIAFEGIRERRGRCIPRGVALKSSHQPQLDNSDISRPGSAAFRHCNCVRGNSSCHRPKRIDG